MSPMPLAQDFAGHLITLRSYNEQKRMQQPANVIAVPVPGCDDELLMRSSGIKFYHAQTSALLPPSRASSSICLDPTTKAHGEAGKRS